VRVFGAKVLPARLVVLFFSMVLLISAAEHVRRIWSWQHAAVAVALLVLVPDYLQLSVSVMVGLPAISLAMLSLLALTLWHQSARSGWLVLSALVLAASVMIKLFTVVLVPAVLVGLLLIPNPGGRGADARRGAFDWRAVALWLVVFACAVGILVTWLVGLPNIGQLIESHVLAQELAYTQGEAFLRHARKLWPIFLLALLGVAISIQRRAWTSLYYAAWMVLAAILLELNMPVWYHQKFLVAAPACILAGVGVVEPLRKAPWRRDAGWAVRLTAVAVLGLVGVYLLWAGPRIVGKLRTDMPNLAARDSLQTREYDVLTLIEYFDPGGGYLITDRPMFAFRANRQIPPGLANLSQKVLRSGIVSQGQIIELIRSSGSPIVLLARFELPGVEEYLDARYDQKYGYRELRLFVRNPSE